MKIVAKRKQVSDSSIESLEDAIRKSLPGLEKQILANYKIKVKLTLGRNLEIESDSILDQAGEVGKQIFKELVFVLFTTERFGSTIDFSKKIRFVSRAQYTHPGGGSNGTDMFGGRAYFVPSKLEWTFA
jgi:hypothetical protein